MDRFLSSRFHVRSQCLGFLSVFLLVATFCADLSAQPAARRETGNFGTLMMVTEDGSRKACELRVLNVRVAVAGRMARTEVEQVFYNPLPRDMEGTYEFELPAGAAVNRLALEVNGKLVEGEVVERQRARQVYEKIVRSMRDPALMEWQSGDRFKTQVYPVPARGTKRVVLAYLTRLEEKKGMAEYRYALPSLAEADAPIGNFKLTARIREKDGLNTTPYDAEVKDGLIRFERANFKPRGDFVIRSRIPAPGAEPIASVATAGKRTLFSLVLAPEWRRGTRAQPRDVVLLADTSASLRGKAHQNLMRAIDQIIESLDGNDRILAIAGDMDLHRMGKVFFKPDQAGKIKEFLASIAPAGGTDLEQLLLAGAIRPPRGRRTVAIYLGDGQASLGELDGDLLSSRVTSAYRKTGAELNAVALGNHSEEFIRKLTRACMGRTTAKEPGRSLDLQPFLASLNEPLLSRLEIGFRGDCARQVLPKPLPNLARGERLEVTGLLETNKTCHVELRGKLGKQAFSYSTRIDPARATKSDLLPVFWARDRIAHLERISGDRKEIVSLSKEFGIMCRYTSWLVLENEEAYKRHQIERRKQQEKLTQPDLPATKGPLKKAKLKDGESVSDFLKDFGEGGDSKDKGGGGAIDGLAVAGKRDEAKEMDFEADAPMEAEKVMAEKKMEAPRGRVLRKAKPSKKRSSRYKRPPRDSKPVSIATLIKDGKKNIARYPDQPHHRAQLIALLVSEGQVKQARQQLSNWVDKLKLDPDKLEQLVIPALRRMPADSWTRGQWVAIFRLMHEARPNEARYLAALVGALADAGKKKEALKLLDEQRKAARKDVDRLLALVPAYAKLTSMREARESLLALSQSLLRERPLDANLRRTHLEQLKSAGMKKEALMALIDWRLYAPDFPDLTLEHVQMLREHKLHKEAERVLSELVEFNPHDFEARSRYAQMLATARPLAKHGQPEQACAQYTRAVQLNPSKRDTFKTMMALRRDHPRAAKAIRQCILDGVSRLPVIRDVSIVMQWEDPNNDIDLHIVEPGGEEVWYQHLESAQGGHLYYDVTSGFGQEIYVLGSGKPGTYRISVVYYSGSATNVRGKIVVMRHAGGPEETRKVYPFTLKRANSDVKIPVGTFKISR